MTTIVCVTCILHVRGSQINVHVGDLRLKQHLVLNYKIGHRDYKICEYGYQYFHSRYTILNHLVIMMHYIA